MSMQAVKFIAVIVTIAMSSQMSFGQTGGRIRDPLSAIKNSFSRKQATEQKIAKAAPPNNELNQQEPTSTDASLGSQTQHSEVAQIKAIASAAKAREEVVLVQTPAVPPTAPVPSQQFQQKQFEVEREIVINPGLNSVGPMQGVIPGMPYEIDADPTAHYPKFGETTGHLPVGSAGLFTFSSARNKRKPFGTSDFDAIPNAQCACDEWCNFCDCGKCSNDLGLDIYRRKPCHHKGSCEGCNDCPPLPRHRTNGINRSSLGPSQ
ncbi:MAG: hypothetical protein ABL888_10720 [Pirellulaceae bacterium]